ncbi:MAG: L-2-amino-thiazoline-4-carboxylic acid hydrolase [Deltaproteobacteria bacterium]|nr:L-2-amino-thiazoline-4-carboxylic acid hydrolase [Deltaproteobacteria bacterium]
MDKNEQCISIDEAKQLIEMTSRRIALLHLSFARTLVDELGEEKGKELILKAIKDYGNKIGEKVRKDVIDQGLDPVPENYGAGKSSDVPAFGMHDRREKGLLVEGKKISRAYGCVLAKVWKEYGEEKLGRLYCYVDPAKYMAFNPDFTLVHLKAMPDGDEYCEFTVRPTTEKEREDYSSRDKDWTYIDT